MYHKFCFHCFPLTQYTKCTIYHCFLKVLSCWGSWKERSLSSPSSISVMQKPLSYFDGLEGLHLPCLVGLWEYCLDGTYNSLVCKTFFYIRCKVDGMVGAPVICVSV